jgi:hypothetical protein
MLRPSDPSPSTYLVRTVASGAVAGAVKAICIEEAICRACVLATRSGAEPQRLDVQAAEVGRA